jgi:hypothetical protein
MKKLRNALVATVAVAAGLLAPAASSAAAPVWNDGFHDEDTIINCWTQQPATGVHANVSWASTTGQVPKIGERFMLRGYIGLVGLPCSSGVQVLPEIMVPAGVEFIDEPVTWGITKTGQPQQLSQTPLVYDRGRNGGYLIGPAVDTAFFLERGDVLEFQFPVKATRELKAPATPQPTCQTRLDGTAPCPIDKAGDHFQVGFLLSGHGGNKWYVTPYVGLFASNGTVTPGPGTGPVVGKAASTTKATWKPSASHKGKVTVVVSSAAAATGPVVVKDKGRTIAKATLRASHKGRVVIRLPKLRRGKHVLTAHYAGSSAVAPSVSAKKTVKLR